jgi:hypothetical protein
MRRIEFIPAPSCSRPTSFRGPKIRARQLLIHESAAEISPEVLRTAKFLAQVLYVGDSRRHDDLASNEYRLAPGLVSGFEGKPQFRIRDRTLASR